MVPLREVVFGTFENAVGILLARESFDFGRGAVMMSKRAVKPERFPARFALDVRSLMIQLDVSFAARFGVERFPARAAEKLFAGAVGRRVVFVQRVLREVRFAAFLALERLASRVEPFVHDQRTGSCETSAAVPAPALRRLAIRPRQFDVRFAQSFGAAPLPAHSARKRRIRAVAIRRVPARSF